MSDVEIYGPAFSTYVWSTRMALYEKDVDVKLTGHMPNSPDQQKVHPFGKAPAFRHGDFTLYETAAILEYIDEVFEGRSLVPADPQERARMRQWMGVLSAYLYTPIVSGVVIQRVFVQKNGGEVDEEAIAQAAETANARLEVVESALDGRQWLAGGDLSAADLMMAPVIAYASMMGEAKVIFEGRDNVREWLGRMQSRPGFKQTTPQM